MECESHEYLLAGHFSRSVMSTRGLQLWKTAAETQTLLLQLQCLFQSRHPHSTLSNHSSMVGITQFRIGYRRLPPELKARSYVDMCVGVVTMTMIKYDLVKGFVSKIPASRIIAFATLFSGWFLFRTRFLIFLLKRSNTSNQSSLRMPNNFAKSG